MAREVRSFENRGVIADNWTMYGKVSKNLVSIFNKSRELIKFRDTVNGPNEAAASNQVTADTS